MYVEVMVFCPAAKPTCEMQQRRRDSNPVEMVIEIGSDLVVVNSLQDCLLNPDWLDTTFGEVTAEQ